MILKFFNPVSTSEPNQVSKADWIGSLRVGIYGFLAVMSEHLFAHLSGYRLNEISFETVCNTLPGVIILTFLDLQRRKRRDYSVKEPPCKSPESNS